MHQEIIVTEKKVIHHNREVNGILYLPNSDNKCPVLIFSHGYNGCKNDFDMTARFLAERGIAAYCFDFCGGSTRDTSGMLTTKMTLFTEKEDLEAVIEALQKLEEIDTNNIFVFGGSQGGLVTALTVDNREDDIRGMILLYPAFCIADNWNERFPNLEDIPDEIDFWGMKLGRSFFESIHKYDVFEHVGRYGRNILVMHGDQDPIVALGYSEKITQVYKNVRLEVYPNEGHGFTQEGNQKMTKMLYDFVLSEMVGKTYEG